MLKHLMNGGSLLSYALYEKDKDGNEIDPKVALREQIAKGNLPTPEVIPDLKEDDDDTDDDDDDDNDEPELDAEGNPVVKDETEELTPEQIKEKEAGEKIAAKAQRKQDRMQRRIDEAVKAQRISETENARLKAQLEANPDLKLTAEQVETRAKALAAEAIQAKEVEAIQAQFDKDCAALQKDATKFDKQFFDKINDVAEQFGPIPSFMIGILSDFENGGEVLAKIANDEDLAEELWDMQKKPAKMTKKLVELSMELVAAKKPPKKQISKVPDPVEPVKGGKANGSVVLTEADTKDMDKYVAKRRAQMIERRKAQGYN